MTLTDWRRLLLLIALWGRSFIFIPVVAPVLEPIATPAWWTWRWPALLPHRRAADGRDGAGAQVEGPNGNVAV